MIEENPVINKNILIDIYEYMWNLEKLSVYINSSKRKVVSLHSKKEELKQKT